MWMLAGHRLSRAAAVLLWGIACTLVLIPLPCSADLGPQGAILVAVNSGPCEDPWITNCHEIIRSTTQDGEVLFMIYFMTGLCCTGLQCIESFQDVLTWPPAWQVLGMAPCGDGVGYLEPDGNLVLSWSGYEISPDQEGVVPLAAVWVNVVGPGRLGFVHDFGEVVLRNRCNLGLFTCLAWEVYAEAGMQCGYISAHCGEIESGCDVDFHIPELVLTAPMGSAADSTIPIDPNTFWACRSFVIDTHAPWCTAAVVESLYVDLWLLNIGADAAGLSPGRYDTWVELSNDNWGVSRCLPVGFLVETPTATATTSWGRAKSLYR